MVTGYDAANNVGLWVTNGTASTYEISVSGAYSTGIHPSDLTVFGNQVLFNGIDAAGRNALWTYSGQGSPSEISGVSGANVNGLDPFDLTVFNNEVLFNGQDTTVGRSLWVTDGTAAGTHEITNAVAPQDLTVFGNEVLFNGVDAAGNKGLWVTDGTVAGTHEISPISGANLNGLAPTDLTVSPTANGDHTSASRLVQAMASFGGSGFQSGFGSSSDVQANELAPQGFLAAGTQHHG